MSYLTSADDTPSGAGRSKVDTYVLKQSAWAKEVAAYSQAQAQALERLAPAPGATTAQIKAAQEKYMQWLQEHARDHKNSIQTKYMDWVVHGYKFMVTPLPVLDNFSLNSNIESVTKTCIFYRLTSTSASSTFPQA
jgi:hypothetical protein